MQTVAIQASLQSTGVGWRSPLSPLVTLHFFFQLCVLKRCSPLYFEPMPNLSKTLITVICMDPQSPNKLIATKYCFLMLGDDTSFFSCIVFVFVVVVILCHYLFLQKLFYYYYFNQLINFFLESYSYFFMFRDVPECSGMFRVPGFIYAHMGMGKYLS